MPESVVFIDEPIEDYPDPIEKKNSILYDKDKSKKENEITNKHLSKLDRITDEDMSILDSLSKSNSIGYDEWPDFYISEEEQLEALNIVLTNNLLIDTYDDLIKSRVCLDSALSCLLSQIDSLYLTGNSSKSRFDKINKMSDLITQMIDILWINDLTEDTIHEVKDSAWFLNSELINITSCDLEFEKAYIK